MKIGLDAHILGKNKGGVERYIKNLVEWLPAVAPQHEYFFFVTREFHKRVNDWENTHFIPLLLDDPLFQRSLVLPWLARRFSLDVLHVQRVCPPAPGCAVVLSIHDVLPLTAPVSHPGFRNRLVRLLTLGSIRRSKKVLTVSETVRREIVNLSGAPAEKVVRVYNGLDHSQFRPAPKGTLQSLGIKGLENPYVLFLGALEPRKNLEKAIEGFSIWRRRTGRLVQLVLAGGTRIQGQIQKLQNMVELLNMRDIVLFPGYVRDELGVRLLQEAEIYLAPSSGEGFNLSALEAMACGTPVVCSDIDVHKELFSSAAVLFRADVAGDLASVLEKLWLDQEQMESLKLAGLNLARKFTWESTACRTAEVYQEAGRMKRV